MLYAAVALFAVAVLSKIAASFLGSGLTLFHHISVTALVLAAVALLFFLVGAGKRKSLGPLSRK